MKIAVIGGGASGLVSAITAKNENNEVIILERNNICGKKILVTGNGHCNYFNGDQQLKHYHSSRKEKIKEIIQEENITKVNVFFDFIGIIPKIKNNYYYPSSNQASTVNYLLIEKALERGVELKTDCYVKKIEKKEQFIITTNHGKLEADIVILSTGGCSSPKTGSDGNGFQIAKNFQHTIIKPLPCLCGLKGKNKYKWKGIRTDAILCLEEDGKPLRYERGELQLTDYGISGICTFNISYDVAVGLESKKKEIVKINFIPFIETNNYKDFFYNYNNKFEDRNIHDLLCSLLNNKLVDVIIENCKINPKKNYRDLKEEEQDKLIKQLISFEYEIIDTNDFNNSQVCSGGVDITEVDLKTFESKKVKNLYFTGEILDVVGDCGGYNLTFAWISGICAGEACYDKTKTD